MTMSHCDMLLSHINVIHIYVTTGIAHESDELQYCFFPDLKAGPKIKFRLVEFRSSKQHVCCVGLDLRNPVKWLLSQSVQCNAEQ